MEPPAAVNFDDIGVKPGYQKIMVAFPACHAGTPSFE
jgi:hypothetical protein